MHLGKGFRLKRLIIVTSLLWVVIITILHWWFNPDVQWFQFRTASAAEGKFRIGFLPVT